MTLGSTVSTFGLWTRQVVRQLIEDKFGIVLSLASVGGLLARLGLTPQKPLQRACERDAEDDESVEDGGLWESLRRGPKSGAPIFTSRDEAGFRADAVQGRTWSRKGQTPVIAVPGKRQTISAASAVNARGAFWFATCQGGLNADLFVGMLELLMKRRRRPLFLVLDNLATHKAKVVNQYVASTGGKLELHYLPGYAPELNPDELVWNDMKRTGTARRPLGKGEVLPSLSKSPEARAMGRCALLWKRTVTRLSAMSTLAGMSMMSRKICLAWASWYPRMRRAMIR